MIKVVKFGGSSLASAEQFKKVGNIIRDYKGSWTQTFIRRTVRDNQEKL